MVSMGSMNSINDRESLNPFSPAKDTSLLMESPQRKPTNTKNNA